MNAAQPALIECAGCRGSGCDACEGRGEIELTTCPLEYAGNDVWSVKDMAELTKQGLPPVHGGALDQAQKFLDACRFIWAEESIHRAELGLRGTDA